MRSKYTPERKAEILAKIGNARKDNPEITISQACINSGIRPSMFYSWTKATTPKKKRAITAIDLNKIPVQSFSPPEPQENDEIMVFMVRGKAQSIGNVIGTALNKMYGGSNA